MKNRVNFCIAVGLLTQIFGCGSKTMISPRINLRLYEIVGFIEFRSSSKGKLPSFASREFLQEIRVDQGLIRIVELGTEEVVLKEIGRDRLDQEAYKALGSRYDVKTIIGGELEVSDVRPDISITPGLGLISIEAEVDASLAVQLVETATGASLWSASGSATEKVAQVSVLGGNDFTFDAGDPEKAYGKLIHRLVERVSKDFRASRK